MSTPFVLAPWSPPESVKVMHGFTNSPDTLDWDETKENLIRLSATAIGCSLVVILLYLIFRLGHCCKMTSAICCCFFEKRLSASHLGRGKALACLFFLIVAGVMSGSIVGRNDFHKGIDSIFDSKDLATNRLNMLYKISSSEGFTRGQTRWGMAKQADEMDKVVDSMTCGALNRPLPQDKKETVKTAVDAYRVAAKALADLTSTAEADMMKDDLFVIKRDNSKKFLDYGVGFTVALAWTTCWFAIMTTFFLSKHGSSSCLSSFFGLGANFFSFIFLCLMLVLVTAFIAAGGFVSDVCYTVPEHNLVTLMKEEAGMSDPLITYYMTGEGESPLKGSFDEAKEQLDKIAAEMTKLGEAPYRCTTQDIVAIIGEQVGGNLGEGPGHSMHSIAELEHTMSVENMNKIFTTLTRDAMCTHLSNGAFRLWVIQAATGLLLVIGLVLFTLVMQSFKDARKEEAQAQGTEFAMQPAAVVPAVAVAMVPQNRDQDVQV